MQKRVCHNIRRLVVLALDQALHHRGLEMAARLYSNIVFTDKFTWDTSTLYTNIVFWINLPGATKYCSSRST